MRCGEAEGGGGRGLIGREAGVKKRREKPRQLGGDKGGQKKAAEKITGEGSRVEVEG